MVDPPCKFVLTLKVAKPLDPAPPQTLHLSGSVHCRHVVVKASASEAGCGYPQIASFLGKRQHREPHASETPPPLTHHGSAPPRCHPTLESGSFCDTQIRTKQPTSEGNGPSHELDKSRMVMRGRQAW